MTWKQGPVPEGTAGYGGVVLACPRCHGTGADPARGSHGDGTCPVCGGGGTEGGFRFARFGGYAGLHLYPPPPEGRVAGWERVLWYSIDFKLPPGEGGMVDG